MTAPIPYPWLIHQPAAKFALNSTCQNSVSPPPADCIHEYQSLTQLLQWMKPLHHNFLHNIKTEGVPFSLAPEKLKIAKAKFQHMLDTGIACTFPANWSSAPHMVPKRIVDWRSCGDYCALTWLLSLIDILYHIFKISLLISMVWKHFQRLILLMPSHIPATPEDVLKMAVTMLFSIFEFIYMPLGLQNATQTFQRFIDTRALGLQFVFVYTDKTNLAALFTSCCTGIVINITKCEFGIPSLVFLGQRALMPIYICSQKRLVLPPIFHSPIYWAGQFL